MRNPRSVAFERQGGSFTGAHGTHSNVEYMIWCRTKWREFFKVNGLAEDPPITDEMQEEFDRFLGIKDD